jgi:UDP-3-O-[3-hydroxymyristoyl] glucosamine N-acyltransferase
MTAAAKPGDPRFFSSTGPHPLTLVAATAGAPGTYPDRLIKAVAPLQTAGPDDVSFLDNRRYAAMLADTKAAAVILHPDFAGAVPAGTVPVITPEPYVGWARVAALFHPLPAPVPGIHPTAIIDPASVIGAGTEIGPGCVIGAGAEIGPGCIIGPLTVIGAGVVIGPACRIGAQVTISHAILGAQVVVYPGARIGQDGFGFAITKTGFVPVPQLGRVLIGNGVEIGANSTIDRGSAHDTVIGDGVHIDNLVQLGHNVNIGRGSVIVAQAGVSGSTIVEEQVMLAAQSGLAGHLHIGKGARIGAQAGVMTDIPAGQDVMGSPAKPAKAFFREVVTLRKLATHGRTPRDKPEKA